MSGSPPTDPTPIPRSYLVYGFERYGGPLVQKYLSFLYQLPGGKGNVSPFRVEERTRTSILSMGRRERSDKERKTEGIKRRGGGVPEKG